MSRVSLEEARRLVKKPYYWPILFIPVPDTDRLVRVQKDCYLGMKIYSSRVSDIISSQALTVRGNKPLKSLELWTDQSGDIYGGPHTSTEEEWKDFLDHLVAKFPQMTGDEPDDATLKITHNRQCSCLYDQLLPFLPQTIEQLVSRGCGLKNIKVVKGEVSGRPLLAFMREVLQRGMTLKLGPKDCHRTNITSSVIRGPGGEVNLCFHRTMVKGEKGVLDEVKDRLEFAGLIDNPSWEATDQQQVAQ